MSIDDFLKIILVIGITISIVGVSWQVMRLISKLTDTIQDTRRVLQNVGEVSDLAVSDYKSVRQVVKSVGNIGATFEGIMNLVNRLPGRGKNRDKSTST